MSSMSVDGNLSTWDWTSPSTSGVYSFRRTEESAENQSINIIATASKDGNTHSNINCFYKPSNKYF